MKNELGIYVHIPFCKKRCYYCDFISYAGKEGLQGKYIEALKKEIKENAKKAINHIVTTIYIGGGTPSYIDSKKIYEILESVKENYDVSDTAEVTIEVNPGTVTKEKLTDYYSARVNRLSIGLQSTNDDLLKQIGRIHTYEQFLQGYNLAREVGFNNINVDLMLGLPNQTKEILKKSLNEVISLNPEHISVYSLILEEGTILEKLVNEKKLTLPSEETERAMYWQVKNTLEQNGYKHYEISNFAKLGYESKHNMNCWEQKEYLGFGVAAHSYYNKTRYSNTEDIEQYINARFKHSQIIHETQNTEEEQKEYMMLGLRKIDGVSISNFKNKFVANPIYIFRKELNKLVEEELIEVDIDSIKLTNKGLDFANMVWEEFV